MNGPECLITGMAFLDQQQEGWIWGDLHLLADILIVNANGCKWNHCADKPLDPTAMVVKCNGAFYEKSNQIVFPLAVAEFNVHANKYLNEMMGTSHIILFGSDKVQ